MDEMQFWSLIERAWLAVGGMGRFRKRLAKGQLCEEQAEELIDALEIVIPALSAALDELSQEDLLGFDRLLERKLYDIDRAEVQQYTDGSDDGFLYARGFIVVAGQAYYEAVHVNPSIAMMDLECEEMCYISAHLYREKFGEMPESGICRESGSNQAGW